MYDELREHLYRGLEDIWFIRDFMRRTGFIDEVDQEGWGYGYDMNGMGDLEDAQVQSLMALLAPDLEVEVSVPDLESGTWIDVMTLADITDPIQELIHNAPTLSVHFQGEPQELRKWAHFIHWLLPNTNLIQQKPAGSTLGQLFWTDIYWVIDWEWHSTLEAWEALLRAWEVMTFYEHVADASRWRILRGGSFAAADADESSAA
ncbi:hypothetical protein [Alicyclobacillus ferrooxydans]|uniref:Uncharacterized protein n=1 Tax=Alicyclobacillus ferrooxydans TaxID=471514 RepID=A0A0P9EIG6_9BACL|nr:hypothetical protein [Alicyclobacillus ferrooxydans]KPV42574.1 hypothetical protein AN477_16900 [Alicyclobacillus ferrooxydans]